MNSKMWGVIDWFGKRADVIILTLLAIAVWFGVALALGVDVKSQKIHVSHVFYYKPNQFIKLELRDGDTIYINASSIESITPHRDVSGDSEVRTLTQEYHVKEDIQTIKDYITEQ